MGGTGTAGDWQCTGAEAAGLCPVLRALPVQRTKAPRQDQRRVRVARTRCTPPAVVTSGPGDACVHTEHKIHDYNGVRVLAWNVGKSLRELASSQQVRDSLAMHDVIALSEIGVGSAEEFEQRFALPTPSRFSWFVKPRPYKHARATSFSGGVAIGVSHRLAAACTVVEDDSACDGLLWVCIKAAAVGLDRDLYVAAVYAPPGAAVRGIHAQSEIWDVLRGGSLRLRQRGYVICVGDFNARTGTATEDTVEVRGVHMARDFARVWGVQAEDIEATIATDSLLGLTLPPRFSEDGVKTGQAADFLLDLCSTTGLAIANGRFGSSSGMFTNVDQNGASVVDYACVDARMWSHIHDFHVLDGSDGVRWSTVSFHRPIVLHLDCIDAVSARQTSPPTKADIVYQAWVRLASEAALLDEERERQRACERHWKIKWDRNDVERVEWYRGRSSLGSLSMPSL